MPSSSVRQQTTTQIQSSVEVVVETTTGESAQVEIVEVEADKEDYEGPVTAELINSRLEKQLAKLRLKDQTSKQLEKEVRAFLVNGAGSICFVFNLFGLSHHF